MFPRIAAAATMRHETANSPSVATISASKKRGGSVLGLDNDDDPKLVRKRAATAPAVFRVQKVRYDVAQCCHCTIKQQAMCSNCKLDGISCIVEKRKRLEEHLTNASSEKSTPTSEKNGSAILNDVKDILDDHVTNFQHVRHILYQHMNHVNQQIQKGELLQKRLNSADLSSFLLNVASPFGDMTSAGSRLISSPPPPDPIIDYKLPDYIKPLPQQMNGIDLEYLIARGAVSLPDISTRNALLQSYLEYVHPYMPLIDLHEFLQIIDDGTGKYERISLLLFQAVLFSGVAFVDMSHLRNAGYANRKEARKSFFQKAKTLYDFDYETDPISLVQSLLLMTYWHETMDDQKDPWHWMGIAIALSYTIGLHKNPKKSKMNRKKKSLCKRIWWSCFMRDLLVAIGMRRPTRVKDEENNMPMLIEDDFEISPLPENITIISQDCALARDVDAQRKLAQMCIAKAKLCTCISHILSVQYWVSVKHQGIQSEEGSTQSRAMLLPKKLSQLDEVVHCDRELSDWIDELPSSCVYSNEMVPGSIGAPLFVHQSLLHMIYFTTLLALHRPQPPSSTTIQSKHCSKIQELSRRKVSEAARQIIHICQALYKLGLEKCLPTTGVTVLLPAMVIHLLDVKSYNHETRSADLNGFSQCMLVLKNLRDNYSSADFAIQLLEAAIKKVDMNLVVGRSQEEETDIMTTQKMCASRRNRHSSSEDLKHPQNDCHILDDLCQINPLYNPNSALTILPENREEQFHMNIFSPSNTTLSETNDHSDFPNFEPGTNEIWNVPLEKGTYGEASDLMGDMDWINRALQQWRPVEQPPTRGELQWIEWAVWVWWGSESES